MRFGNLAGRMVLVSDGGAIDLESASDGRLPSDPHAAFECWDAVREWAEAPGAKPRPFDVQDLHAPSPRPRQVFGIGLNYRSHALETGQPVPGFPATFTKFPTCLGGPGDAVPLPSESVDWEVELVAIIGRRAYGVEEADAWSHVSGLTVGQDLSERTVQLQPPMPQFSLGKSYPGFGPTGPWLVTPDEFDDPDDLAISCSLNGEQVQSSRTSDLIFSVPRLIHRLSSIVPLESGDVIFTGTPAGVGVARKPPRYLRDGDELVSTIEGIGSIHTRLRGMSTA